MIKVHTDDLSEEESELMQKYLAPQQVDQIDAKVQANRQAGMRCEAEGDLDLQVPAHLSPQTIQGLQRFKTYVGKNLEDLTKWVYRGLDTSKFKSCYSSVAHDRTFKPYMKEAGRSVLKQ